MNIKKFNIIAVSVITMLALVSPAIYAQGCAYSDKEKVWVQKKEAKRQELYKELNVSEEQRKALEENKNKHREQMKALFNEMKEKKTLIRQELQKDTLDMAKINQVNGDLKKLQAQMLDYRLQHVLEVRKILTPEQFKKFMAKMEEKMGHFKNKHKGSQQ